MWWKEGAVNNTTPWLDLLQKYLLIKVGPQNECRFVFIRSFLYLWVSLAVAVNGLSFFLFFFFYPFQI